MSAVQPTLRNLQFSPFKEQDEQYVVLWDPSGLSPERLVVPLNYFYLLQFLDGEHSLDHIAAKYLEKFGEFLLPDRLERLVRELDDKLFLEGEKVEAAKRAASERYRAQPARPAAYAGKVYDDDPAKLARQIDSFFTSKEGPPIKKSEHAGQPIRGLVAPHYDLREAGPVYAWAYKELQEAKRPELIVLIGTCHAGLENFFAVTDKDFVTPLGTVKADRAVLANFRAHGGERFFAEDRSHQQEHSLEFQLPFLQRVLGDAFTIVPVLCTFPPFLVTDPQYAEQRAVIEQCLAALEGAIKASGRSACVVASAELAHIGMRYGDSKAPTDFAFHRCMQIDLAMLKHVEEAKPQAFAESIVNERDERRISGFAAIYSLLRLVPGATGEVLRYDRGVTDQFNSTVTYAAMAFF